MTCFVRQFVCVWLLGMAVIPTALAEDKQYPAIQCQARGREFDCVAINVEQIKGQPFWRFHTYPLDSSYGYAYASPSQHHMPKQWTLLEFTVKDSKNNVYLKILVRAHDGGVQFAATDDAEQHVVPDH